MDIRPMDQAAAEAFTRGGKHDQMSMQKFGSTMPPTRVIDNYYSKGSGAVIYGFDKAPDAVYDKLHDDFIAATDAVSAKKILQDMDQQLIEQHYLIAAPEAYDYIGWQPYLKGYSGESLMWGQGIIWSRLWTTGK